MLMSKMFLKSAVFNDHTYNIIWVNFFTFGFSLYIIRCQKGIFECVCVIFCILLWVYRTRKFLVCPKTFGLKLLVLFLVLVSVPVSPNFNFLVSFQFSFWKIWTSWFRSGTRKPTFHCSLIYKYSHLPLKT